MTYSECICSAAASSAASIHFRQNGTAGSAAWVAPAHFHYNIVAITAAGAAPAVVCVSVDALLVVNSDLVATFC